MAVYTERAWRVVFRGFLPDDMLHRLAAAEIVLCGEPWFSGQVGRGGHDLFDYPLRVAARDADHAFVRVTQVLGDGSVPGIIRTPTPVK